MTATSDDEELKKIEDHLADVLANWPLYREFRFSAPPETAARSNWHLPDVLSLYCDFCKHDQIWEWIIPRKSYGGGAGFPPPPIRSDIGFDDRVYGCRNCRDRAITFYYRWYREKTDKKWVFQKVGQFPPPDERVDRELEQQLKGEDLDFYRKALRLRNFNLGIAALGYLRRVVENRMNDLLDIIAKEARQTSFADEELKKIDEVKRSWRFSDKLEYAAKIVPPGLRPDGHNPLSLFHGLSSEAIHSKSEDECIEIFDKSRLGFEYFFKNLKIEQQEREAYRRSIIEMTK